jgi:hypothetical protein
LPFAFLLIIPHVDLEEPLGASKVWQKERRIAINAYKKIAVLMVVALCLPIYFGGTVRFGVCGEHDGEIQVAVSADENSYTPFPLDGKVVWIGSENGQSKVFCMDLETGEKRQLGGGGDQLPSFSTDNFIYASENHVVWLDQQLMQTKKKNSIWFADIRAGEQKTVDLPAGYRAYVNVSGGIATWPDYMSKDLGVYFCDLNHPGEKPKRVHKFKNSLQRAYPVTNGKVVAYEVKNSSNLDLMMYDIEKDKVVPIDEGPDHQYLAVIQEGFVYYQEQSYQGNRAINRIKGYNLVTGEKFYVMNPVPDEVMSIDLINCPDSNFPVMLVSGFSKKRYTQLLGFDQAKNSVFEISEKVFGRLNIAGGCSYGNNVVWTQNTPENPEDFDLMLFSYGEDKTPEVLVPGARRIKAESRHWARIYKDLVTWAELDEFDWDVYAMQIKKGEYTK